MKDQRNTTVMGQRSAKRALEKEDTGLATSIASSIHTSPSVTAKPLGFPELQQTKISQSHG